MVCAVCQHDNPDGNRYCGECGHALGVDSAPAPRHTDRAKLVRKEAVVVAAGVVLLLAAAFGFWWLLFYRTSPEGVVRRFLEADQRGDVSQQKLLVVDRWDGQLVLSILQSFRQQAGVSAFQRYRVSRATVSGDSAAVEVIVYLPQLTLGGQPVAAGGSPPAGTSVTFFLLRENHEWKVDPTQTLAALAGMLATNGLRKLLPPGLLPRLPPAVPGLPGLFTPPGNPPTAPAPGGTAGP